MFAHITVQSEWPRQRNAESAVGEQSAENPKGRGDGKSARPLAMGASCGGRLMEGNPEGRKG